MWRKPGPALLALMILITAAAVCGESGTTTISQATATATAPVAPLQVAAETPTTEAETPTASPTQPPPLAPTDTPVAAAPTDTPAAATPTSPPEPSPSTPTPSSVGLAARVNGQPIPLETYQQQVAQAEAFFIEQQGLDPNSEKGKETLSGVRRQVLEQLIDQALIEQAAQREGVTVSDEKVESTLQDIIAQMGQTAFDKSLEDSGMTREQLKEQLRSQLLGDAVFEKITGALPTVVEQVHARHILLSTRQKAEEVLAKLQGGQDFGALAREYSEDPSGEFNNGDLGWFPRGIMAPEFEAAAFSLQVGEISDIVETQFGFHIIEVLERDPAREIPPEMAQAMRQQRFLEWLGVEREKATIERFISD